MKCKNENNKEEKSVLSLQIKKKEGVVGRGNF